MDPAVRDSLQKRGPAHHKILAPGQSLIDFHHHHTNRHPAGPIDSKHNVVVIIDGHEIKQHGPFPDADAAEAMAVLGRALRPHLLREVFIKWAISLIYAAVRSPLKMTNSSRTSHGSPMARSAKRP